MQEKKGRNAGYNHRDNHCVDGALQKLLVQALFVAILRDIQRKPGQYKAEYESSYSRGENDR